MAAPEPLYQYFAILYRKPCQWTEQRPHVQVQKCAKKEEDKESELAFKFTQGRSSHGANGAGAPGPGRLVIPSSFPTGEYVPRLTQHGGIVTVVNGDACASQPGTGPG